MWPVAYVSPYVIMYLLMYLAYVIVPPQSHLLLTWSRCERLKLEVLSPMETT